MLRQNDNISLGTFTGGNLLPSFHKRCEFGQSLGHKNHEKEVYANLRLPWTFPYSGVHISLDVSHAMPLSESLNWGSFDGNVKLRFNQNLVDMSMEKLQIFLKTIGKHIFSISFFRFNFTWNPCTLRSPPKMKGPIFLFYFRSVSVV